jgi:type IV fimbrial biogenesis protein FimT
MACASISCQHGFSLIEIVAALGITATALLVVMPDLADIGHSNALSAASQELLLDLHLARSEALKRHRRVTLCKSADGAHCSQVAGWEQGWILFHDANGNGALDAGEERIGQHEALQAQLRLRGNEPVADYLSFTASGVSKLVGGGFQAGTLTLCRASLGLTTARQVILNSVGRPRVQSATVARCG